MFYEFKGYRLNLEKPNYKLKTLNKKGKEKLIKN